MHPMREKIFFSDLIVIRVNERHSVATHCEDVIAFFAPESRIGSLAARTLG
jgi:hypothetical protein